jgi:hypothetical protein
MRRRQVPVRLREDAKPILPFELFSARVLALIFKLELGNDVNSEQLDWRRDAYYRHVPKTYYYQNSEHVSAKGIGDA